MLRLVEFARQTDLADKNKQKPLVMQVRKFFKFIAALIVLTVHVSNSVLAQEHGFELVSPSHTPLAAGEDIRIGMSNALSGPTSALGTYFKQGAEVYLKKVNESGGIHGHKLSLISYDDGYEPLRTISNTRTLIERDQAFLLFGYVGTPTSRVAIPIAAHAGVPFIAPMSGARFLRNPTNPLVYNVRASYDEETENIVRHLVDKMKHQRIGLMIQNDGYGNSGREGIRLALAQRGLKIVAVGKYERNTTDIRQALDTLRKAKPDAVVLIGAYAPCAEFIKAARSSGFDPTFMNISFVGTKSLLQALDGKGNGVYISQVMPPPADINSPLIQAYLQDSARYMPSLDTTAYSALEGYFSARVLVKMLEAAGPQLSRQGFVDASNLLANFAIEDINLYYDVNNHQASHKVYMSRIDDGHVVPVAQ